MAITDEQPADRVERADLPDEPAPTVDLRKRHRHERFDRFVDQAIDAELHTGRHEETVEEARHHLALRVVRIGAGVVVLLIGVVLLAMPGPGLLVIALGLGLLAQDVPFAARLLDNVRRRLPQDDDGKLPRSTIAMMVAVGVVAVAGSVTLTVVSFR